MSRDNNSEAGTARNFASRLLNKAIQERKTGEMKKPDLTVADAEKFAITSTASKQPVAIANK
jgi:hypothetical protein